MKPMIKSHVFTVAWVNWYGKVVDQKVSDVDAWLRRHKHLVKYVVWVDV